MNLEYQMILRLYILDVAEICKTQKTRILWTAKMTVKEIIRTCPPVYRIARKACYMRRALCGSCRVLFQTKLIRPLKIVIGAAGFSREGWISTDIEYFNILKINNWARYFRANSIDALLAEHVWEHLTYEEGLLAAKYCHKFLKVGGYVRIAVPDGFNPSSSYIENVKVGGVGSGADDHKVLYDYESLSQLLISAGFKVNKLEYFDREGKFNWIDWDTQDGYIARSRRYDQRNNPEAPEFTSVIVDAFKVR